MNILKTINIWIKFVPRIFFLKISYKQSLKINFKKGNPYNDSIRTETDKTKKLSENICT